jgi:pilus assembly protein CpaE
MDPDALGTNVMSVALIGPQAGRRAAISAALRTAQANVTKEFETYPELDDVRALLEEDFDVIIIELDHNPEYALDLVENICVDGNVTVMVYSSRADSELLVRCMRAGAREFLTEPIALSTIAEALVRASVRRPAAKPNKKTAGKLAVFMGSKGGCGVTTIATNFALALAQESGKNTLLIDLNLPLGDIGIDLGISAQYSTADALQNSERLDFNYLSKLLVKHSSGLSVLAAPDKYVLVEAANADVERLLMVARQNFDYVVVDAGSRFGAIGNALFNDCSTVYLVTQVGLPDLRNSNRLISELLKGHREHLEIILNRYTARSMEIDEESITKALTMPAKWKIPSDFQSARTAQNTATPLALGDSPISRVILEMSQIACGKEIDKKKKSRFKLFG